MDKLLVDTKSNQVWQKQGQIYQTRAQCPTVLKTTNENGACWRIFFADRNAAGKAFIRYIDVNPDNPKEILFEESKSILEFGPPGSFDASGVMPTCVIKERTGGDRVSPDGERIYYLFYIGWGQRLDVPYHNAVGIAYSYDGRNFEKSYPGPVLGTSAADPFFTGTACVVPGHNDKSFYTCYYLSCNGWLSDGGKLEPTYRIKEATTGGLSNAYFNTWRCKPDKNGVVIDFKSEDEGGISNATVFCDDPNQIKHMWFCYRNKFDYRTNKANSYRIGYATGYPAVLIDNNPFKVKEKARWVRQDSLVDLPPSEAGWDSEMICYPNVIKYKDTLYMFYNGNGFGSSGFGYATLPVSALAEVKPQ